MRRLVALLSAGLLLAAGSGCTTLQGVRDYVAYNDVTDDFVIGWRHYVWANQAWQAQRHAYADQPHWRDFGEGFRAGYREVAAGGNGCPPALPPRNYWSWRYQSPEGQARMAAWFAGYTHGAIAAGREGLGHWRQIAVSPQIEQQYSPEFQAGRIPRRDACACPPTSEPATMPPEAEGVPEQLPPLREHDSGTPAPESLGEELPLPPDTPIPLENPSSFVEPGQSGDATPSHPELRRLPDPAGNRDGRWIGQGLAGDR